MTTPFTQFPINTIALDSANVTATGSTAPRTLADRFADTANVKNFGAAGNGIIDDTAAINAAVTATPAGGMLVFPTGTYKVSSTITLLTPINIIGMGSGNAGPGSVFSCSGLSGSASLFKVSTTVFTPNWQFKNFAVNGNSTGLYAIEFAGTGGWYEVQIDNLTITGMSSGYSIGTTGITTAGLSYSTISNCNLVGGIFARYGGDGLHIENNVIGSSSVAATYCVYYNGVAGAAGLVIAKNVLSGALQLISIDNAQGPVVFANELETTPSATSTYAARIGGSDVVASTIGGNHGPLFIYNHISILAGGSNPTPLYFNNCSNAVSRGGGYEIPNPGGSHIFIDSAASLTYIEGGNGTLYVTNGVFNTPHITDNGSGTHIALDFTTPVFPTVASLPSASAATSKGMRYLVNDATVVAAGNFGATVTGGGANVVPVYSDGTNWRIG
jgi:hypothetical protein